MTGHRKLLIALAAGIAVGTAVIQGLHAQASPTYVVIEISAINDPEAFKAVPAAATPASLTQFGGKYVFRSDNIVPITGPAPKRMVVIEFDTLDHAKAWRAADGTKAFEAIREKSTTSREFLVGGM